jgi:hypothetical protein
VSPLVDAYHGALLLGQGPRRPPPNVGPRGYFSALEWIGFWVPSAVGVLLGCYCLYTGNMMPLLKFMLAAVAFKKPILMAGAVLVNGLLLSILGSVGRFMSSICRWGELMLQNVLPVPCHDDDYSKNHRRLYEQRVILTEQKLIGVVPQAAEVGDKVVLLRGSRVPLVFRKLEGGKGQWKWIVIGDCYVHGVMFGEAWSDADCQEFVVC